MLRMQKNKSDTFSFFVNLIFHMQIINLIPFPIPFPYDESFILKMVNQLIKIKTQNFLIMSVRHHDSFQDETGTQKYYPFLRTPRMSRNRNKKQR